MKKQYLGDIDKDAIKVIKNIRFTDREIDIIACLIGGRPYKKIASILSISSKTVDHHVHNIALKIGCNSRDGIIDFIEKSDKFTVVKDYYVNILVRTTFEQELKKISSIAKEKNLSCLLFHDGTKITKASFISQLERHLNIAGIKTVSKVWVKDRSKGFLVNKIGAKKVDCVIYVLSGAFVRRLSAIEYDIQKEAAGLISLVKESLCSVVFLLLDDEVPLNKSQSDFIYISLPEIKNYYFLFSDILQKILPNHSIDKSITNFKKQYEIFQVDSMLQRWSRDDGLRADPKDIKKIKQKKKKSIFKWSILFFICLIGLGFAIFKINNRGGDTLIYQPQNNNPKVNDNKQKITMFNMPPRNRKFTGRSDVLLRIKEQLNKQKIGVIAQTISGLGGIGKTQLAKEYAYRAAEKKEYSVIFWIPAETTNSIDYAYRKFAKFLQIDIRGLESDKIKMFVHQRLTKKYKDSKVLFILDNVPDYENIRNYIRKLNEQLLTNLALHILITSRNQHWPEKPLLLNTFTPQEALEFAKKRLPEENEGSLIKLIKALHYYPLALNQATAYIKQHTNVDDYLDLYSTRKKDYLNKFSGDKNQYEKSLWKAWSMSLAKLSDTAKEILFISSYLYPDDIPIEFFDNMSIEKRGGAIKDLRRYSLINLINNNKSFKIHRLLQEVIRKTIALNNKSIIFGKYRELIKADKLLRNKFDCSYAKYDTWALCGQYLSHVQSLVGHEINVGNKFFHKGIQLYCGVAMYLTHILRADKAAKEAWEKVLLLIKPHCTVDKSFNLVLASIYTNLSYVTRRLGSIEQTKKYIKKAISIYESKISIISKDVEKLLPYLRWDKNLSFHDGLKCDHSFAIANWAHNIRDLAKFNEAINFYTKALKILSECKQLKYTVIYKISFLQTFGELNIYYGKLEAAKDLLDSAKTIVDRDFPNHMEQSYVYERISVLLYHMGLYDEAKKHIEKVLNIRMNIFSKNHYRIAT